MQVPRKMTYVSPKNSQTIKLGDETVLLKNKDFFKPEDSVWNNPYRSSTRLYKYYHAINDIYQKYEGAALKQQQERDKENTQKHRITKLIHFRNQIRQTFKQRQQSRKILELCSKGEISFKLQLTMDKGYFEKLQETKVLSEQTNDILHTFKNIYSSKPKQKNPTLESIDVEFKSSAKSDLKKNYRAKIVKSTQNLRFSSKNGTY